jgi:hypothetical protein
VTEQAEQTSGEAGSPGAEPIVPNAAEAASKPVAAQAEAPTSVESPNLAPEQGRTGQAPDVKAPEAAAAEPRPAGRLMIMAPSEGSWSGDDAAREAEAPTRSGLFGKGRLAAMAAVVALAAVAGALGGALATANFGHPAGEAAATAGNHALEASVARIDADVLALKASVEHTSRMGISQFNKTGDRLDKLEKAQAEPAAKLAKLSEAVEKLHAAPPPAPVAAAAPAAQTAPKEVTGSVTPAAPALVAAPKADVARLPTIDDWILRDVSHGGALIEGRRGVYEVFAGDPVPGLGRIDAIRRQDGRWVVVTSRGLIVER